MITRREDSSSAVLRMTERQHRQLYDHLFPGDGKEAVAVALCGRAEGGGEWEAGQRRCLSVYRIEPVPHNVCTVRTEERVIWPTDLIIPLLVEAEKKGMALLKVHSHPGGYPRFSAVDDASDCDLFPGVAEWVGTDLPHASAVMLPSGHVFARLVSGRNFTPIDVVTVAGEEIRFFRHDETGRAEGDEKLRVRTRQAFGPGTTDILAGLSAAVIGVSGTGSPTVEMLARLAVGELILVDDDRVENKNRGRILNTFPEHAAAAAYKVDVIGEAVRRMGFGTRVVPIARNLWDPSVVRRVAQADVIFGCMDTVDGRDLLNRLAAFYCIPYLDVGVALEADGRGGVDQICGTVHYLQPGGSSLASRSIFTPADVRAASLRRTNPAAYEEQVRAGYLRGVRVERPAVISVNMLFAALGVNELLARLHGYRDDGNTGFAAFGMSLTQARLIADEDGVPCPALAPRVGRGDCSPLLGVPELGVRR